jgi:formate dehydrogenase alpha subunit
MASTTAELVTLTIDGMPVTVPKGTLVIEAARQAGIMIPHFCYHPKLKPDANCRMCLVEIERVPRLQTSCSTPVAEGMVVRTATTVVDEAHKSVLEFILANHPLDCPVCDQGGRCDLQDFSHEYTPAASRFVEIKRVFEKEYFSPLIETQMNRCVQCLRCVRYCDEVMDVKALAPVGRGTMTEIKHFSRHELECEFCGGCIQICPVGAITSRLSMYEFRPWMLKRTDTICTYCGDGCAITVQTKNKDLIEVNSALGAGRNNGDLCVRGYFGYHASTHPDRLTQPLIRRDGHLEPATWEDALTTVAESFLRIKLAHGAPAFAGLITGRCTNEEQYLFQKFMRLVLGTNKIDSSARYGHVNGIHALRRVQGIHRWPVTFDDILAAQALLLVGTNITETNPVTGLRVKEAVKKCGATLVTIESLLPAVGTISNIANLATHHFTVSPDRIHAAVLGLLKALIEEGLVHQTVHTQAPAYVRAVADRVHAMTWASVERAAGATARNFADAARAFAGADRAVVLAGPGVLRTAGGSGLTTTLLDILILTGHAGLTGCGLAPLAEENNDQGAVEMGATAGFLPGGADLEDEAARAQLAACWKSEVPQTPARTLMEILEEARAGTVRALYLVGENPAASLPPGTEALKALRETEFLVCQDLFMTETARLAHVVLPACSYVEKEGSFTNTEGHVQAVRPAIPPIGESRPDWEIMSALSVLMGYPLEYGDAKELLKEIRAVVPGYGPLGPSPQPPRPSASAVERYLGTGYAEDIAERYALPSAGYEAQGSREDGKLTLTVAQSLFHSGKFSTHAKGLLQVQATGWLELHPSDAERLDVQDGARVRLSNGHGEAETAVRVLDRIPPGTAWFPEHFDQDVRRVLDLTVDPVTRVPYYKTARVTIEKA